jgi:hypothetical protein
MQYVWAVIIIAVGGSIAFGAYHIHHENQPGERPSMRAARQIVRGSRMVASGDLCLCGGTLGDMGQSSPKFGALLNCSGCARSWTADGRRVVRRRPRVAP